MLDKTHPLYQTETVVDCVRAWAAAHPEKLFARIESLIHEEEFITYRLLMQRATQFSAHLRACGVQPEDVVVIILEQGSEIMHVWLGAVLMGAIPSLFAFPSSKMSLESYRRILPPLLENCQSRWIITSSTFSVAISEALPSGLGIRILPSQPSQDLAPQPTTLFKDHSDRMILLQHSSGTTGLRKGIALSNKALLQQLRHYADALDLVQTDKIASWLPLYHDMGLVACFLLPMLCGIPVTMMSPFEWIADPAMLLRAITKDRSTLCWLPNFAYNVLANHLDSDELTTVNLTSIRAFINCSEPILEKTHRLFAEKFKAAGLSSGALATCYAMAENTFAVTQGGIREAVRTDCHVAGPAQPPSKTWVSSGTAIPGTRIRIVNEARQDCPDRHVGEIAIQSDSLFEKYYRAADAASSSIKDGWFYTGDLGYLVEGHLFVTGRKKDMIITAGKNIYPQDVEEIISALNDIRPGRVVCFGIEHEETGTQKVVVLAETHEQEEKAQLALRLAIAREVSLQLECTVSEIALLPPGTLLKSTSGKISRSMNRQKFQEEWRGSHR